MLSITIDTYAPLLGVRGLKELATFCHIGSLKNWFSVIAKCSYVTPPKNRTV